MNRPPPTAPPGHRAAPWSLETGARPLPDGSVRFRVWAPHQRRPAVEVLRPQARRAVLRPAGDGMFEATLPGVAPGADYRYVLDDGRALPDPVSRWQPEGVHGPSRVVDPAAFAWSDRAWRGVALEALVPYELHVGTFTAQGTFLAAMGRLEHLRALGITAIEVMPVAEFPGGRNWGYDGVALYAPQSTYGGPEGFKALVDAAHRAGLAVILDVVYNHVGPEGNYLHAFGPYFTDRYATPWGDAINYDGADSGPVRRHVIDNALYWLTEYHVDALRLDAVHGIFDFSARHVLAELRERFHEQTRALGRQAWVIAESDLNDARVIAPPERGGWNLDAQWSDDFHHALYRLLTGNDRGYFADFGRVAHLARALSNGFVYEGQYSVHRRRAHGNSSAERPGRQFVVCTENHDQVANGAQGQRLSTAGSPARERLAAALLFTAPFLPMLFMGQEYGEVAPFLYFTSHGDPALAEAVREGRRREFEAFGWPDGFADPQLPATFERSRLDWSRLEQPHHAGMLRYYRQWLALRRATPCLAEPRKELATVHSDEAGRWLVVRREHPEAPGGMLWCNLNPEASDLPVPEAAGTWERAIWSGHPDYGDEAGTAAPPARLPGGAGASLELGPWEAVLYLQRPEGGGERSA